VKLDWNFQRGGVLEKIPSVGEVWISSGTTKYIRFHLVPVQNSLFLKNFVIYFHLAFYWYMYYITDTTFQ